MGTLPDGLPEPPAGLFDRIILAIRKEQELRNTRKLAFGFLALLVFSFAAAPFSWAIFASQAQNSGILQFIEAAGGNISALLMSWQELGLAIAEALPIGGMVLLAANMIAAVFTLRLFLYKKRLLVGYLLGNA